MNNSSVVGSGTPFPIDVEQGAKVLADNIMSAQQLDPRNLTETTEKAHHVASHPPQGIQSLPEAEKELSDIKLTSLTEPAVSTIHDWTTTALGTKSLEEKRIVDLSPQQKNEAIAAIREKLTQGDSNLSTQKLLGHIVKQLRELGYEPTIESQLAKSDDISFGLEKYTLPSSPDEAYYKIPVSYTIKVAGEDLQLPNLQRVIFTTSTDSETALSAANRLKETVTNIAMGKTEKLDGYEKLDDEKRSELNDQRTFSFRFSYNVAGQPTALLSVLVETKNKETLEFKVKEEKSKYEYLHTFGSTEIIKVEKGKILPKAGQTVFATEEEALAKIPYTVKDHDYFDRLENKKKPLGEHIELIEADIKNIERRLSVVKESFKKDAVFNWFRGKKTQEFKEMLANISAEASLANGGNIDMTPLSPSMRNYVLARHELKQFNGNPTDDLYQLQAIKDRSAEGMNAEDLLLLHTLASHHQLDNPTLDQLIEVTTKENEKLNDLKKEIQHLQLAIANEQAPLNAKLTEMQKLKYQLSIEVDHLETIRKGAQEIVNDPSKPQEAKAIANKALADLTQTKIDRLKQKGETHQKFIDAIVKRLNLIGGGHSHALRPPIMAWS